MSNTHNNKTLRAWKVVFGGSSTNAPDEYDHRIAERGDPVWGGGAAGPAHERVLATQSMEDRLHAYHSSKAQRTERIVVAPKKNLLQRLVGRIRSR